MAIDLEIIKGNLRYVEIMLEPCQNYCWFPFEYCCNVDLDLSNRASFGQTVINFNSSNVNVLVILFSVNFVWLIPLSLVFFALISFIPCIAPLYNSQFFHFNFWAICYSCHLDRFPSNHFIHCFQELARIHAHNQSHLWKNCLWAV